MARYRPHMPLSVKLEACLLRLDLDPKSVQWDHDPALERRTWDDEAGDYDPRANDPRFIVPRDPGAHARKTTGRAGESRFSANGGGDTSQAAKLKRLSADQAAFRSRMLTKEPGEPRERKGSIKGRPFPKSHRPLRSRNTLERTRP